MTKTLCSGVVFVVLSAFAFDASPAAPARTVTLAVTYSFAGQYTNTQQLDEKSCNVRLTETADYRGWQQFSALKLPLSGNASASSKERLRLLTGKWTMRGAYYPGNDCSARSKQLDCTGAVRFNAHGPRHGLIRAQVSGGAVVISVATGYADIFESDTYAIDPTVGSSTPAACLAPLSPYLGLRDATAPLMRVVAKTSSARLAKLRPGQKLMLTLIDAARTGAVKTCYGRGGCMGRMQHGERLTLVLTG